MSKQVVFIWKIPKAANYTSFSELSFLRFILLFNLSLKSTLKNRSCDPIFQGHVCKFVDSVPGCTNMQSKCRFVQETKEIHFWKKKNE